MLGFQGRSWYSSAMTHPIPHMVMAWDVRRSEVTSGALDAQDCTVVPTLTSKDGTAGPKSINVPLNGWVWHGIVTFQVSGLCGRVGYPSGLQMLQVADIQQGGMYKETMEKAARLQEAAVLPSLSPSVYFLGQVPWAFQHFHFFDLDGWSLKSVTRFFLQVMQNVGFYFKWFSLVFSIYNLFSLKVFKV